MPSTQGSPARGAISERYALRSFEPDSSSDSKKPVMRGWGVQTASSAFTAVSAL